MKTPAPEALKKGRVYMFFDGKPYRVGILNDCRARLDPLFRKRRIITDRLKGTSVTIHSTPASISISNGCKLTPVIVRSR